MFKLAIAAFGLLLILGPAAAQGIGWIHVAVQDDNGAVIPGLAITIREAQTRASVASSVTNEQGESHFSLPSGLYIVEAKGEQILSYKRAPLHLEPNKHIWVVVIPIFVSVSVTREELEKRLKYREFAVIAEEGAVSVRYVEMSTVDGVSKFQGHIELSFGSTTLLCDALIENQKSNSFECSGSVRLFMGNEQFRGNMCQIDLTGRTARLTREPVLLLPLK